MIGIEKLELLPEKLCKTVTENLQKTLSTTIFRSCILDPPKNQFFLDEVYWY